MTLNDLIVLLLLRCFMIYSRSYYTCCDPSRMHFNLMLEKKLTGKFILNS